MEFEAIIPLVTAITAAFGIPYAWRQAQHLQGSRSRSDFNFVKKYIRLTQESQPHPFVIESGFRVIRKKSKLDSPEILYRACPRFCVTGYPAGDCRSTRRHHEHTQTRGSRCATG